MYCTQADLEVEYSTEEIARIADRAVPPAGSADAAVVSNAIAAADAEIDGYLRAITSLPLASTPALIKYIAMRIARYRLYDDQATEKVRQDYEDGARMLRDVYAGKIQLFDAPAEVGTVVVKGTSAVFTDALLGLT